MADVKINVKVNKQGDLKQTTKEFRDFRSTFTELQSTIGVAKTAYKTFTGVFKTAMDWGKQGAAVNQTAESFGLLLQKVGAAPDLLQQLRRASKGTVDDMQLMSSTATLLAGTSGDLATQLANNTPRLLEIAKAAQKLNPALGDTTFLYNSIATGVKRASPLILDNLGLTIKIGKANEDYAKALGKTTKELTADEQKMALLNATLDAGNTLIEQAGGNADSMTDSFAKLETASANLSNELKGRLAPFLAQAADASYTLLTWNKQLTEALGDHEMQVRGTSDTYQDYITELNRSAGVAGLVVDTNGDLIKTTEKWGVTIKETKKQGFALSEAQWEVEKSGIAAYEALREGLSPTSDLAEALGDAAKKANDLKIELGNLDREKAGRAALDDLKKAFDEGLISQDEYIGLMSKVGREMLDLPQSQIFASIALARLRQDFQDGKLSAQDYVREVEALGFSVEHLPSYKEINIHTKYTYEGNPQGGLMPEKRQGGGPMMPGRPYQVNEGPFSEVFVPSVPGRMVPSSTTNNMGGDTFMTVNLTVMDSGNPHATAQEVVSMLRKQSRDFANSGAWSAG